MRLIPRATTVAAVAAISLVVSGCTSAPERDEAVADISTETYISGEQAESLGLVEVDRDVVIDPRIAEKSVELVTAGRTIEVGTPDSGPVAVTVRSFENAAALSTAFDSEGRVAARAISVEVPGLESIPVEVSYESTAFTRLLFSPQFVTDSPLQIALLRGIAESVPAWRNYVRQIEQSATTDPEFDINPTVSDTAAFANVVAQVEKELDRLVTQVETPSNARVSPTWALPPSRNFGGADCLVAAFEADLCLARTTDPDEDADEYLLTVTNRTRAWTAAIASPQPGETYIAGLVPPKTFTLPPLWRIAAEITAAASVVTNVSVNLGNLACKGLKEIGHGCQEDLANALDPLKAVERLRNNLNPNTDGKGDFYLTSAAAKRPLFTLSGGFAEGDSSAADGIWASPATRFAGRSTLALMTIGSQVVLPSISLVLGLPSSKASPGLSGEGDNEASRAIFDALVKVALTDGALHAEVDNMLAASAAGQIDRAATSLLDILFRLVTNPDLLAAFFAGSSMDEVLHDAIKGLVQKYTSYAVPGVGWFKAAATVSDALSVITSSYFFFRDIGSVPVSNSFDAYITSPETAADAMDQIDWQNFNGYMTPGRLRTRSDLFNDEFADLFNPEASLIAVDVTRTAFESGQGPGYELLKVVELPDTGSGPVVMAVLLATDTASPHAVINFISSTPGGIVRTGGISVDNLERYIGAQWGNLRGTDLPDFARRVRYIDGSGQFLGVINTVYRIDTAAQSAIGKNLPAGLTYYTGEVTRTGGSGRQTRLQAYDWQSDLGLECGPGAKQYEPDILDPNPPTSSPRYCTTDGVGAF